MTQSNQRANYEELSPLLFLQRSKYNSGENLAVIDEERYVTYLQFNNEIDNLKLFLSSQKIAKDSKVAFVGRNSYPFLISHYAVPALGAVIVGINHRLAIEEIEYILQHSNSKMLIIEEELFSFSYLKIVTNCLIISHDNSLKSKDPIFYYHDLTVTDTDSLDDIYVNENDTISINYTSGTSGKPKGVMYSHRGSYLNSIGECLISRMTNNSKFLWVLPMFHCNGWCYTWAVTAIGATHVLVKKTDPENILLAIQKHQITHMCAAPTVLISLYQMIVLKEIQNLNGLTIVTAGSPPSSHLIKSYQQLGILLIHVYGLTETYGPHLVCQEIDKWQEENLDHSVLKARQGIAAVHSIFADVVDTDHKSVKRDGETYGEIVVRGNNVMKGYYNDQELTERSFEGGWFHTGDIAVIHSDGYIEVKDRLKDIIISGGENISSIEIEQVIYQLEAIEIVAVIPGNDDYWGEVPVAFVELKKGYMITREEIIHYCKDKLPGFKCPKEVYFDNIPKTATGKIQKNVLKQKLYDQIKHK